LSVFSLFLQYYFMHPFLLLYMSNNVHDTRYCQCFCFSLQYFYVIDVNVGFFCRFLKTEWMHLNGKNLTRKIVKKSINVTVLHLMRKYLNSCFYFCFQHIKYSYLVYILE
jgi:hypothetical protein